MSDQVKGQCPMGCGDTLFIGSGGYITCSWHACPNPTAVADLLRLGELFDCPLHEHLNTMSGPPRHRGRFRVIKQSEHPSRWLWIRTDPPTRRDLTGGED